MRLLVLCSLLCAASPALASGPVSLFRAALSEPVPLETHAFRVSTSPTAYLETTIVNQVGGAFLYPGDAPHVDAFIADLTNGVNNPVTLTNGSFSYTVDEDYFLGDVMNSPFLAYSNRPAWFVGQPDLAGITFWRFELGGAFDRYHFYADGTAPEPSSTVLFVLCACCLHGFRVARSPQSTGY